MLRHDVQDDLTMRMSVSRESHFSKKRQEYLASNEISYKVTHRPGLKDETDSPDVWQFLKATKRELTMSLNTSFVRLKGRHTKRIGRNVDVQLELVADTNTQGTESDTVFSTKALLKYSPLSNFKTYLGLQVSDEGLAYIFGAKIAGIKVLIPW